MLFELFNSISARSPHRICIPRHITLSLVQEGKPGKPGNQWFRDVVWVQKPIYLSNFLASNTDALKVSLIKRIFTFLNEQSYELDMTVKLLLHYSRFMIYFHMTWSSKNSKRFAVKFSLFVLSTLNQFYLENYLLVQQVNL